MRSRRRVLAGGLVLALGLLVPLRGGRAAEPPPRELIVLAAASLRECFAALAGVFEARHPGVRVRLNLAGSQELRVQIEQGAAADVFVSADPKYAAALEKQGLVQRPVIFAHNLPVVAVPHGDPAGVKTFAGLPRAKRLVIGAPEVPIGAYTVTILEKAAKVLGPEFADTIRRNVVSRELNVRQVLAKATLGEADAVIVYRTDAQAAASKVDVIEIPAEMNVQADYAAAAVKAAPQAALAADWMALLLSPEGQAPLVTAGFRPVAAAVAPAPAGAGGGAKPALAPKAAAPGPPAK